MGSLTRGSTGFYTFKQKEVGELYMTRMVENVFGWRVARQDKYRRDLCFRRSRKEDHHKELKNRREAKKDKAGIREKEK